MKEIIYFRNIYVREESINFKNTQLETMVETFETLTQPAKPDNFIVFISNEALEKIKLHHYKIILMNSQLYNWTDLDDFIEYINNKEHTYTYTINIYQIEINRNSNSFYSVKHSYFIFCITRNRYIGYTNYNNHQINSLR